jgi:3-isopropylmalate dehydrogenase
VETSRVKVIADPTAATMSAVLLLAHVEQHLATRGDEKLSTAQVGDRIAGSL